MTAAARADSATGACKTWILGLFGEDYLSHSPALKAAAGKSQIYPASQVWLSIHCLYLSPGAKTGPTACTRTNTSPVPMPHFPKNPKGKTYDVASSFSLINWDQLPAVTPSNKACFSCLAPVVATCMYCPKTKPERTLRWPEEFAAFHRWILCSKVVNSSLQCLPASTPSDTCSTRVTMLFPASGGAF